MNRIAWEDRRCLKRPEMGRESLGGFRRIMGQAEAIEQALEVDGSSEDVLQLGVSCHSALNGLMAGLIEGKVRFHLLPPASNVEPAQAETAEELMPVIKRYFK